MAEIKDEMDGFFDEFEPELEAGEEVVDAQAEEFAAVEESGSEDGSQKQETAVVTTKSKEVPALDDLGLDFSALQALPGTVVGDIGIEVSRLPVERVKFTANQRALISIVSGRVTAIKCHYDEEVGSFLCFGGSCCETGDLARVKYLFPVVVYDTDKRGKPVSREVSNMCLAVGKDQYEDILAMQDLNGDITKYDILVACKDENYQKLSFQLAGEARWKRSEAISKPVIEFWRENIKHLVKSVARQITEKEYLKAKNAGEAAETAKDVNFDDVFD